MTGSPVASHVGIKVMELAMGMISAGHAIRGTLSAFLGGFLFDMTVNYSLLWKSSIWLAVGAGVLAMFLRASALSKLAA